MQGFFLEYTGISVFNYVSVLLGAAVYVLIMTKFIKAQKDEAGQTRQRA